VVGNWDGTEKRKKNLDGVWGRSGQYGGDVHTVKICNRGMFRGKGAQKRGEFD